MANDKRFRAVELSVQQRSLLRRIALYGAVVGIRVHTHKMSEAEDIRADLDVMTGLQKYVNLLTEFTKRFNVAVSGPVEEATVFHEMDFVYLNKLLTSRTLDPDNPEMQRQCVEFGTSLSSYREAIIGLRSAFNGSYSFDQSGSDAVPNVKHDPRTVH